MNSWVSLSFCNQQGCEKVAEHAGRCSFQKLLGNVGIADSLGRNCFRSKKLLCSPLGMGDSSELSRTIHGQNLFIPILIQDQGRHSWHHHSYLRRTSSKAACFLLEPPRQSSLSADRIESTVTCKSTMCMMSGNTPVALHRWCSKCSLGAEGLKARSTH